MIVFINNRDLLTWPRAMADLLAKQGHKPIILDNASTYGPLLRWYNSGNYQVIRLDNLGPRALWKIKGYAKMLREPYCYTDPDLDISSIPPDWPDVLLAGAEKWGQKCGFSLDETRIPKDNPAWVLDEFIKYPDGDHPKRWGKKLEAKLNGRTYYRYPIDTTFALYLPHWTGHPERVCGTRAGRPYTARHLPWHIVLKVNEIDPALQVALNDELCYYYDNASPDSTTAGRLRSMRYQYKVKGKK